MMRFAKALLRRLRRSEAGAAAVEFAIAMPVLLLVLGLLVDFGFIFNAKLKLIAATAAGAQYAYQNGQSVTGSTYQSFAANVTSVIQQTANLSATPSVTVSYNNVTDGSRTSYYYCLSGSPTNWSSTSTTVISCGGSVMSGKFVTIAVSSSMKTLFPGNPIGDIFPLSEKIIVRVQ